MVGQMAVGGDFITLLRLVCREYFLTSASYHTPSAASLNKTLFFHFSRKNSWKTKA